jgi:very-short-patch-repair endonuclease
MVKNIIIPYNPNLKQFAGHLRNNSTLSEILFWKQIKNKAFGIEFHRQVPIDEFIVDFYCYELRLAIEIDGISHDFKYEKDLIRQGRLENLGVHFIRFDDQEVKNNMFRILLEIQQKIEELEKNK